MYGSSIRFSQPVLAAQPLRMKRKKVCLSINLQMPEPDCTGLHESSSATSTSLHACYAGLKNILRGCLLAFLATFAGCFLFFTLPDLIASQLNKQLPYWFYANEVRLNVHALHLCQLRS